MLYLEEDDTHLIPVYPFVVILDGSCNLVFAYFVSNGWIREIRFVGYFGFELVFFLFNDITEHSDYGVREEDFISHFFKAFIINTLYLARSSPSNTL